MAPRLPDAPDLVCVECGGAAFIPLTYPSPQESDLDPRLRPTAKCVTCGWLCTERTTGALRGLRSPM